MVQENVPGGKQLIEKDKNETISKMNEFVSEGEKNLKDPFGKLTQFPEEAYITEKFIENLKELRSCEKEYQQAKAFGGIYYDWEKKRN